MYTVLIVRDTKRQGLHELNEIYNALIGKGIPCKPVNRSYELRVAEEVFSIKCMIPLFIIRCVTPRELKGVRADAVVGVGDFERVKIIQNSKLDVGEQLDTIKALVSHIEYKYNEYINSFGISDNTKTVKGIVGITIKAENKEQCDEVICAVIGALMTHKSMGRMKDVHDCSVQVSVTNDVGTESYTQDIK